MPRDTARSRARIQVSVIEAVLHLNATRLNPTANAARTEGTVRSATTQQNSRAPYGLSFFTCST